MAPAATKRCRMALSPPPGAFEEIAFVRLKEFRQVSPGLIDAFIRHFQHPVMLEAIPELLHLFRQLIGQQIGKILQKLVRQLFGKS